ncbi:MAG: hypothetical protein J0L99_11250 [Chitinophagales bacterium]|nr:hypothetical protein [Chitinophagales bacterium]
MIFKATFSKVQGFFLLPVLLLTAFSAFAQRIPFEQSPASAPMRNDGPKTVLYPTSVTLDFCEINRSSDASLCKIKTSLKSVAQDGNSFNATAYQNREGRLVVELMQQELKDARFLRLFGSSKLWVGEDLELPRNLAQQLGFSRGFIIRKNYYALERLPGGGMRVIF